MLSGDWSETPSAVPELIQSSPFMSPQMARSNGGSYFSMAGFLIAETTTQRRKTSEIIVVPPIEQHTLAGYPSTLRDGPTCNGTKKFLFRPWTEQLEPGEKKITDCAASVLRPCFWDLVPSLGAVCVIDTKGTNSLATCMFLKGAMLKG